jgi:beta-glucosidase
MLIPCYFQNFAEGKLVDWKWFQAHNITERFAFGHGLSYSTFRWADLVFIDGYKEDNTSIQRTNERFHGGGQYDSIYDVIGTAYIDVTNTGTMRAAEVAQLYITFPEEETDGQPPRLLRGFDKLWLQPGETKRASFPLRRKDVSIFDVGANEWRLPSGEFTLSVGSSSVAIHSTTTNIFA